VLSPLRRWMPASAVHAPVPPCVIAVPLGGALWRGNQNGRGVALPRRTSLCSPSYSMPLPTAKDPVNRAFRGLVPA
jgi:hypothetical protein